VPPRRPSELGLQAHHTPKLGYPTRFKLNFVNRCFPADVKDVTAPYITGKMYIFKLDEVHCSLDIKRGRHFNPRLRSESRLGYQGNPTIQSKAAHGVGHAPLQRNDTSIRPRIQGVLQNLRIGTSS